ncbi:PSD1 and planctomycete cytochrome C domain-containing protein [Schlesneria paludicola]|uniref:PSD1 and planctomycete cytochrome C domain-containing protein n=1 Tax=Schlesneria paludicola TaxID=360056 RepID=UPI00029ABD9B|nr:PSD1 and planctomycete cytochrome C domain-containing protein [Schlesneria paludicola]
MLRNLFTIVSFVAFAGLLQADETAKVASTDTAASTTSSSLVFEKDVLPILQAKCVACHGEKTQKAELNLSTQVGVKKGSSSGQVVVAGKVKESLLLEVLHEGLMPPPKEGEPLTSHEVEIVQKWVESGAQFAQPDAVAEPIVTEREISQILFLRCTVCHNGRVSEGGLDLRSRTSMLKGGKSGPAINLKKPAESLVLKKIHAGEMPPLRKLASASVKVIEKAEVETLAKWIEAGAPPTPRRSPGDAQEGESEVTAEDRQFWSFQTPRSPAVPVVKAADRVRNPIDAFVLEKLESVGLTLSPEADRRTLIRRAHFDLIGLPPTPAEVEAFVQDSDPKAYEKLIDRLLNSSHYGERWGRYWLDVAGYSDSDGVNAEDPIRHYAWRYRDYVIRSFNKDKPYDRFLLEQIAGDELVDHESSDEFNEEIYDNLVATGFLRMAPDGTYNGLTNFVPDRLDVIASEIDTLTSSLMGLTVKCARCHSHKFDPIPHRDYYRLAAVFKGAYDENDWMRPSKSGNDFPLRGIKYVRPGEKETWEAEQKRIKQEMENLKAPMEARTLELVTAQVEKHLAEVPEIMREDVRVAALASRDKRNEVQKYLVSKFEKVLQIRSEDLQKLDPNLKSMARATFRKIKALKQLESSHEPFIQALWDRGEPTPTYILRRGNYLSPGKEVEPGVPAALVEVKAPFVVEPPWPGAKKTGRRLGFARWLTSPDHPLTSRVMVNRIWKHHFANGIVKSLDNFGKAGQRPTHPELLDWLAVDFVQQGWSIKAMHRLIMTSATYRQTSEMTDQYAKLDLENRLLSRSPLRRLEAEVLRDSLLFVAGKLDETPFGPAEKVKARGDGLVTSIGTEKGWRRSIYVLQRRSQASSILEDFDLPQMAPNCVERTVATVAPQALHLLNNKMIHGWSIAMADRILNEAGADRDAQINRAYEIALGRRPDAAELELTTKSFDQLREKWLTFSQNGSKLAPKVAKTTDKNTAIIDEDAIDEDAPPEELTAPDDTVDSVDPNLSPEQQLARNALTNLCHALMNSAEFIYID